MLKNVNPSRIVFNKSRQLKCADKTQMGLQETKFVQTYFGPALKSKKKIIMYY